ncbi:cell adhesion molecule CEACAM5-like [Pituophis catenifer annectens]|uniref:cell adhesion molecule CEACAM5-like n=1 Tax=Pituophis catenifer annectens TaxID=94852 RepID=UPI0039925355
MVHNGSNARRFKDAALVSWKADSPVSTNIALDPEKPEIGGHVTLIPSGDTNTLSTCSWFRGGDDEAKPIVTYSLPPLSKLAFKDGSTGREFLNSDCSLHIKNLTTQDEGFYKGVMEKNEGKSVGKVYLRLQGLTGRKGNRLSTRGIIGIAVSSFFVVSVLVGLTAYQIVTSRSSISHPAPTTSAAAVAPVAAPAPAPAPIPASTQAANIDHLKPAVSDLWESAQKEGERSFSRMSMVPNSCSDVSWHTGHALKPPGFQLAAAAENVTIDVKVDPDDPDIGWDVALSPSGVKANILACHWYRGETNNFFEILAYHPKKNSVVYGPASRHRERIRPDCTLLIRDVIVTDSDFYAVYKNTVNRSEVGTATLIVRDRSYYAVERRTMSPLALLGIIVSSGTGFAFIVSLMLYRTVGRVKR